MLKSVKILVFALALFLGFSCSGGIGKTEDKIQVAFHPEKGKVNHNIQCKNNQEVSYELYLPGSYDSLKKYPVIFCFDSHGSGLLPVNLLQSEAEKLNYILIGSNNSKNGLPLETTIGYFDEMYKDAELRYSIDNERIYTMGFSGGSRVASSIAFQRKMVSGVVGCSAGLGQQNGQPDHVFTYLGVVGNEDFNLTEMSNLMKMMDKSPFPHFLLIFDGKHAWPPKELVPDIFAWTQLKAMKEHKLPVDTQFVRTFANQTNKQIKERMSAKDWYQAWYQATKGYSFLEGFPQQVDFQKIVQTLSGRSELKKILTEKDNLAGKEIALQQEYISYMQEKGLDWWKSEVTRLTQLYKSGKTEKALMYKRLMSYISLAAYMSSTKTLKDAQLPAAEKFIGVLGLVEPENTELNNLKNQLEEAKRTR